MDDKTCDLLNEVDEYFNNRGVNVAKFNKNISLKNKCPYDETSKEYKCTTNNDRVNALSAYLYDKISEINKTYKGKYGVSKDIEVFMIWLGDKLFKIDNDYKITLEESYKNNLEISMGNNNYWKAIDSQKIYKKATIKKMSDYYNLLNYICKLITEYNKNPQSPNRNRLGNYSTQCDNYYKTIHKSINGCKPYLQLLDSLKTIFEIFRAYKIVNNNSIQAKEKNLLVKRIKSLTTFKGENQYFVTVNPILSFDDKECVEVKSKDEQIGEQILQNKPKGTGLTKKPDTGPQKKTSPSTPQRKPTTPAPVNSPVLKQPERSPAKPPAPSLQASQKSEASHQSGAKGSDNKKGNKGDGSNVSGGAVSRPESSEGKPKDAGQKKSNPVGIPSPGPKEGIQSPELKKQGSGKDGHVVKGSQGGSSIGIDGRRGSVQGDQGKSSDKTSSGTGGQGGSDNQTKHSGVSSHGNPAPASSGAGTTPSPVQPPSSVQLPSAPQSPPVSPESQPQPQQQPADSLPKDSLPSDPPTGSPPAAQQPDSSLQTSDPQKPDTQPQPLTSDPPPTVDQPAAAAPAQDGKPSQTSQTGGSSNQNEQKDSSNSKGGTGGTKDNKGNPNDGNKDPGGGSSDSASNTSGGSFGLGSSFLEFILKGKEYYDKASEFIKDNQQKFKDAAKKISGAYNNTVENLKSAYNASSDYLNKFISDVTSQLNQVDPPKSGDNQTGPGNPSGGGNPTNQLPPSQPSTSKDSPSKDPPPKDSPLKNTSPPPPLNPASGPSKGSSQQSQSLLQLQPITQQPTQTNPYNQQTFGQFVKSLSSDLILKKPWNIFPTTWNGSGDCKPEIKFMNATLVCCTSEQCSLTGILITIVLIPIILSIAYKYLSFGSSKKSEKKNMKRVINFHDGNRKTKIIISSNDRNKDLKPVINSVGRKKDSLLNIYKLIRADPMPFINLFFLLIFFVYKRKRDIIES
ncbi:PIR protein CIR protein [Plasmodium vinckei brucechwatti]|uniref:PIR protein CIR protein n=1 Tax=Plasmodium vinckei brucechwatti TaxID=119398 RepID=A0A6V7T1W6_PLAVN|nr:PIR protein CIR protein [Plasmodium vinckei brucechwatti]